MPPLQPVLVCLSPNTDLRETRRRVLQTRYQVIAVSSVAALQALPLTISVQVLVLCHALSVSETAVAIRYARETWPSVKILGISAPHLNPFRGEADAVLGGLAGPRAMLDSVEHLLSHSAGLPN